MALLPYLSQFLAKLFPAVFPAFNPQRQSLDVGGFLGFCFLYALISVKFHLTFFTMFDSDISFYGISYTFVIS